MAEQFREGRRVVSRDGGTTFEAMAEGRHGSRWTEENVERLAEALWAYEGDPAVDWKGVADPQFGRQDEYRRLLGKAEILLRFVGSVPVGEPDDRLTKLEAAAKDAMEALDEYLRGESGLPFAQPYPAARKAWERLNGALPDG